MSDFTVDYFIAKFEAIPEDQWCEGKFIDENGCKCALGHCGTTIIGQTERTMSVQTTPEADALARLFCRHKLNVTDVNDRGWDDEGRVQFMQPTPRGRILAALRWIKEQEGK